MGMLRRVTPVGSRRLAWAPTDPRGSKAVLLYACTISHEDSSSKLTTAKAGRMIAASCNANSQLRSALKYFWVFHGVTV